MKPIKLPHFTAGHNDTIFIDVDMGKGRWNKMRKITADGQVTDVKNNFWYWVKSLFR